MLKSNKINKFIWVCDISQNTGEGRLAHLFLNKEKIKINKYSKHKINNKIFSHKYIYPLVGIFFCWYNFLKKKKYTILTTCRFGIFLFFYFCHPKQ
jgi:hypothetical protein